MTRDPAAFRRLVRIAVLGFLQDIAARDWEAAAGRLQLPAAAPDATPEAVRLALARRLEREFLPYFEARGRFRLDPEGRSALNTHWDEPGAGSPEEGAAWPVAQVLSDPEGLNDWEVDFTVPLAASRAESSVVLRYEGVHLIGLP